MSDLLSDKKIKQLCVKYLAWDEPVSNRDLELIKPLFKAQNAKTKKGLVKWLQERTYGFDDGSGEMVYKTVYEKGEWQALKKEVKDG